MLPILISRRCWKDVENVSLKYCDKFKDFSKVFFRLAFYWGSHSRKTNMVINLILGNKLQRILLK
ncbi:hypothetical protein RhiirA5_442921 [Rhizophagus irregularis]|uniref:Uncharacterized protein n=1 Tax=Rhizophagus irregularis TaxID=588596 RepID=A0A2N0NEB8_9GLOM|nr:hypothetical protein RhiirA5_442921 [Rhizophagus irregularis]